MLFAAIDSIRKLVFGQSKLTMTSWPSWCIEADQLWVMGWDQVPTLMTHLKGTQEHPKSSERIILYEGVKVNHTKSTPRPYDAYPTLFQAELQVLPKESILSPLQLENQTRNSKTMQALDVHLPIVELRFLIVEYALRRFEDFEKEDWIDVKLRPTEFEIQMGDDITAYSWHQGIIVDVRKERLLVRIPKFLFRSPFWVDCSPLTKDIAPWNTQSTLYSDVEN